MKMDMHCHTAEGSIDSRVPIREWIRILQEHGIDGMLVTDHDSYRGYRYWEAHRGEMPEDFVVLKGIEYDTRDAGHFLVIMPDGFDMKLLSVRGLRVEMLIRIVHRYGGVLGPAHPYGMRSSSAMLFRKMKEHPELAREFDFLEGLNTCELQSANLNAVRLAKRLQIQYTAGSDAHKAQYVGTVYTEFDRDIRCNDDLIACIRERGIVGAHGKEREFLPHHYKRYLIPTTLGFIAFNRAVSLALKPYRKAKVRKMDIDKGKLK